MSRFIRGTDQSLLSSLPSPSLSLCLSLLPSSLPFQYSFCCTISYYLLIFFCPNENASSTHLTPKTLCLQQSYIWVPQRPRGLTTGHQGCQLGEVSLWGCICMWKARALPSEELSWHVFLPCVEGLTSWSYQQGIKICSVDLMHMRFISPCSCPWRFYSYLSVYRQNRGMMSDLQHEDLVKLGQSPLLSSLFFFVEVGKVVSK